MGTDVELETADAGDLPFSPAPSGKQANIRRLRSPCGNFQFLLEEADCGTSRLASNISTDLFEANAINGFLQHLAFNHSRRRGQNPFAS